MKLSNLNTINKVIIVIISALFFVLNHYFFAYIYNSQLELDDLRLITFVFIFIPYLIFTCMIYRYYFEKSIVRYTITGYFIYLSIISYYSGYNNQFYNFYYQMLYSAPTLMLYIPIALTGDYIGEKLIPLKSKFNKFFSIPLIICIIYLVVFFFALIIKSS
ncbi:hypothetical protein CACET_c07100 [Clostridium aceticum]|uniref:Uncharacterized protein n=1 Tax=Clostridium aceticum TaxID=84022 RepID=A0A0D8IDU0_9CLOT|nr:hypothetical protein CACET_c07100 [Clostridium aceticum]KJF28443.1 hypothetical protein TZ02_00475 [Clostridium aceticum]